MLRTVKDLQGYAIRAKLDPARSRAAATLH